MHAVRKGARGRAADLVTIEAFRLAQCLDGDQAGDPEWMAAMAEAVLLVAGEGVASRALIYARRVQRESGKMTRCWTLATIAATCVGPDWPPAALLDYAFQWNQTLEGTRYWSRIHCRLGGQRALFEHDIRRRELMRQRLEQGRWRC